MTHREQVTEYLESLELQDLNIIDWGAGTRPVSKYVKATNCTFTTVDKKATETITPDIVWDMSIYKKAGKSQFTKKYDMAFCIMVLEHVEKVHLGLHNIYNSLKNEGKAVIAVPFLYPEHSEEDYWRFTEQGIRLAMTKHPQRFVIDKIIPLVNDEGFIIEAHRPARGAEFRQKTG